MPMLLNTGLGSELQINFFDSYCIEELFADVDIVGLISVEGGSAYVDELEKILVRIALPLLGVAFIV